MRRDDGHIRVLFLADYEGRGLDPRLTRSAIKLASFCDLIIGTWGGEVEPGLISEVARSGLQVKQFQFPFHPSQNSGDVIRSIRECSSAFDVEHITVVHCQCYRHLVLCRLASTFSHYKPAIVFTDHNSDGRRGMRKVTRLGLLAAMWPQVIDLDNYLSRVPFLRTKGVWLSNPVDTSFFRSIERPPEFSKTVSLIFPARLTGNKGHVDLIKICSHLKNEGLRFRLVLAGDGQARQSLEDLVVRLDLREVVHFAGQLNRPDLLGELLAADIGIFPSPREMLPVAVLEMMATGLPVVAYGAGGIPLIIRHGETGFVTPIGSKEDFERHLKLLITNPLLARQIGREAASDVRLRFDTAVITQQMSQLYRHSADRRLRSFETKDLRA